MSKTFSIEMPKDYRASTYSMWNESADWDEFQKVMDQIADATNKHTEELAKELGVSFGAAADIVYLRSRE